MKCGLVLLLAVVLAACQADKPASRAGHDITAASNAGARDPLVQRLAVQTALLDYMLALTRACHSGAPVSSDGIVLDDFVTARDACLARQIQSSLGLVDVPEGACTEQAAVRDLLRCALFGSAAVRIITAAQSDPAEMMNWADPEASLNLGARLLATRAALNCSLAAQISCVTREMGTALLLPATAVDACAGLAGDNLKIRCVATEFLLDHIRWATLYVS